MTEKIGPPNEGNEREGDIEEFYKKALGDDVYAKFSPPEQRSPEQQKDLEMLAEAMTGAREEIESRKLTKESALKGSNEILDELLKKGIEEEMTPQERDLFNAVFHIIVSVAQEDGRLMENKFGKDDVLLLVGNWAKGRLPRRGGATKHPDREQLLKLLDLNEEVLAEKGKQKLTYEFVRGEIIKRYQVIIPVKTGYSFKREYILVGNNVQAMKEYLEKGAK